MHMPPKSITRIDLPDPIAMAVAIDPQTATLTRRLNVDVETAGQLTRGQTVIDHLRLTNREPNADVVLEASRERFDDLHTRRRLNRPPAAGAGQARSVLFQCL
jgi:inosine-uridine nucleoside N-ribohydrolase